MAKSILQEALTRSHTFVAVSAVKTSMRNETITSAFVLYNARTLVVSESVQIMEGAVKKQHTEAAS